MKDKIVLITGSPDGIGQQTALDLARMGATSRVIAVSSATHQRSAIDSNNLQGERHFGGYDAYARSKLANILFADELAARLKGTGVTSNSLHPGVVATKLLRAGFSMSGASLEEGAATSVYLASSPDVASVTGRYVIEPQTAPSSPASSDPGLQTELWKVSERLSGIIRSPFAGDNV